MAEQAKVRARFDEAIKILQAMQRAQRNPNMGDGEVEFRSLLVSFMSLGQSCVTMAGISMHDIDNIIKSWSDDDRTIFSWFRNSRNESLKGGEAVLKVSVEHVTAHEYRRRCPPPAGWHPAYEPLILMPPGTPPTLYGVNVYELDIDGVLRPALQTCVLYLELVKRFLQDPRVFGPGF